MLHESSFKGDEITIFAGPCSVESAEQFEQCANFISSLGLSWIRGGAFKPRTNPHAFQGLGAKGVEILSSASAKYKLKTLTEVMDSEHLKFIHDRVDGLQIGARNFQNFALLKDVGKITSDSGKFVLYKRGFAGTIQEWLSATEYITGAGNHNVMLCERGIRTFETATRFTFDVSAIPVVQSQSFQPICADVSHPTGIASLVPALAMSSMAAGANAIMVEVHPNPHQALSDGPQQLNFQQFEELLDKLHGLASALGKTIV